MAIKLIRLILKMISTKRITSENINFEHKKRESKKRNKNGTNQSAKDYPRIIVSFINLIEESPSEK